MLILFLYLAISKDNKTETFMCTSLLERKKWQADMLKTQLRDLIL